MDILFFNVDKAFLDFMADKEVKGGRCLFFEESFNTIDIDKLAPFFGAGVISAFVHSEVLDNTRLDLFPNLSLIATRSTGFNHIDLNYCKNRDILVANVPNYGAATVAEFAFGLLLGVSRKIIRARNAIAHNHLNIDHYMGVDLWGKTVGVIGTGAIGRHFIDIAKGFGMHILAYDKYPNPELSDIYVSSLDELYQQSDIISLHIPSTPENYHLLDENAFSKMKNGVYIINTARGDLIDTQSLYLAIKSGKVAGAGLDVLENEDFLLNDDIDAKIFEDNNAFLLDSALNLKLMQFKNVIITPHIAFNSTDAITRINQTTLTNITSFINNTPINLVKM